MPDFSGIDQCDTCSGVRLLNIRKIRKNMVNSVAARIGDVDQLYMCLDNACKAVRQMIDVVHALTENISNTLIYIGSEKTGIVIASIQTLVNLY